MGNNLETVPKKLKDAYNPNMQEWTLRRKTDKVKLWQHKATGEYLEEFAYVATDSAQLYRLRTNFEQRFGKHYVVSARFFKEKQTDELCSTFYQTSMFIEFIGLRLSQFRDVPFPDSLHLYNACLHGFGQLQARVGFFDVSESLVGLNQAGQVKVWTNPDFFKERPKLPSSKEGEEQMLREVIDLVDCNIDVMTEPQSISLFIKQKAKSFQQAVAALRQYAANHQVQIPTCLQTVNHLRAHGVLDGGPFIRKANSPGTEFRQAQQPADKRMIHRHPISQLQSQMFRPQPQLQPPVQKANPTAIINSNPQITAVMYQPIQFTRNNIATNTLTVPRPNIIVNTQNNQLKEGESYANGYLNGGERLQNIKQSEIVSEMNAGISPENEAALLGRDGYFRDRSPPPNKPIYLSTLASVDREAGTTSRNVATLNKKYFNIPPLSTFNRDHRDNAPVSRSNSPGQGLPQTSIANMKRNIEKRTPPIFTSLQGSGQRRPNNFKGSEPHGTEFFNNTIIYSIENEVRRDQMEASQRLDSKKSKLRVFQPIDFALFGGQVVSIQRQHSESGMRQSAMHVFSITVNNKEEEVLEPVKVFSEEVREPVRPGPANQGVYKVHYNSDELEPPIRYTESAQPVNFNLESISQPSEQVHGAQSSTRYSYMPNYSFDKNCDLLGNCVQVSPRKAESPREPCQIQEMVPIVVIQRRQAAVYEEPKSSGNIVFKASIKNPSRVESSLRLVGHSSEIIQSIKEIRQSQKQLLQGLKPYA